MFRLIPILILISGCTATGHSVGVSHSFDSDGVLYHAPHVERKSEKLDVQLKYFMFQEKDKDFMNVDWEYKF
jgi:hypothetical protein